MIVWVYMNYKIVLSIIIGIVLILVIGGRNKDNPLPLEKTPHEHLRHINIMPNQVISSPLEVTGEARLWYFEGDFPIYVIDTEGKRLGVGIAMAQDNWMTEEFVPFQAKVDFDSQDAVEGFLVLQKNNPSDLRELDDELRIPVIFESTEEEIEQETRTISLYAYNPLLDDHQCSQEGFVRLERTLPQSTTPLADSIRLLITEALTEEEKDQGITSEYPLPGFELISASITDGTATLTFNDPESQTVGGSCRVSILYKQIELTAKQFESVQDVVVTPEDLFQP